MMIHYAFNVDEFQISGGPNWIDKDRYNLEALPAAEASDVHDDGGADAGFGGSGRMPQSSLWWSVCCWLLLVGSPASLRVQLGKRHVEP